MGFYWVASPSVRDDMPAVSLKYQDNPTKPAIFDMHHDSPRESFE